MVKQKRTFDPEPLPLNFQHLRYFWAVAKEGNLTRAAEKLNITQSAVSVQLRKLEDALGQELFTRGGRGLELTEVGRLALDYADAIFEMGERLVEALEDTTTRQRQHVRVGAQATLSRNFQIGLLGPLLADESLRLTIRSGTLRDLVERLERHELDLVLSNFLPRRDESSDWVAHTLDTQGISLVASRRRRTKRIEALLAKEPLVVPSKESGVRIGFDAFVQELGVRPRIVAEVDDMAMLRLVARTHAGLAVVPPIVVHDELVSKTLVEVVQLPDLVETFYALTTSREVSNPAVAELISRRPARGRRPRGSARL